MPVMDGVAATRAIRALGGPEARTPIVGLTANTQRHELQTYAEAGMNDCLAKPVSPADLMACLSRWTTPAAADVVRAA